MANAKVEESLRQIKKKLDVNKSSKKHSDEKIQHSQFDMLSKIRMAVDEANDLYAEYGDKSVGYYEESVKTTDKLLRSINDVMATTLDMPKVIQSLLPQIDQKDITIEAPEKQDVDMGVVFKDLGTVLDFQHREIVGYMDKVLDQLEGLNIATSFAGDTFDVTSRNISDAIALLPAPKEDVSESIEEAKITQVNALTTISDQLETLNKTQAELNTESTAEKSTKVATKQKKEDKLQSKFGQDTLAMLKSDAKMLGLGALAMGVTGILDAIGNTAQIVGKADEGQVTNFEAAFGAFSSGLSSVANMLGVQTNPAEVYSKIFGKDGWVNQFLEIFGAPDWQSLTEGIDKMFSKFFMGLFEFVLESVPKFFKESIPNIIKDPIGAVADGISSLFGFGTKKENQKELDQAYELSQGKASPLAPAKMAMMGDGFTMTRQAENEAKRVQVPMAPVVNNVSTSNVTTSKDDKRSIPDLDLNMRLLGM
jgi:hypothetical protein